ncbi:hypothetical protein D3C77_465580 [compost metagenome]
MYADLGFAIEVAHGEIAVADTGAQWACLQLQRLVQARRDFEVGFALVQAGDPLTGVDVAGECGVGVQQDFGAVLQLQALALTDHSQVIGLQAQWQVADGEHTDQQHRGSGQGFPVRAQARQTRRTISLGNLIGDLAQGVAVPECFRFDIGLGIGRIGFQPGFKGPGIFGAGALQADQPVQRLVHGTVAGSRVWRRRAMRGAIGHGRSWVVL